MGDLNYHHLHYFRAVAQEGNLTRAAATLGVSQSAVSVQIKKLEEQLGAALFDRSGRGLKLTEPGRVALDYAEAIFAMGDELVGVLGERADSTSGLLRVGVLSTLSRNFQLGFLDPLLRRPDVRVTVRSGPVGEMLARLEAHQLDVVLTNSVPARGEESAWVPHTLAEQPISLIGGRRPRRDRSLAALLTSEPIVVPTPESSIRVGFDALVARLDLKPQIAAEIDDMAMLRLYARSHPGLTVIPPIVVQDELHDGTLEEVVQLPELLEVFSAITLPRRSPNPLVLDLLVRAQRAGGASSPALMEQSERTA